VAVNSVGGVYVKETTGTSYPGYAAAWSFQTEVSKKKGVWKSATRMTGEEYLSFIEEALAYFKQQPGFPSKVSDVLLLHDKSRQHRSKTAVEGLHELGLAVMVQPPRSPDLMPLDYGIFGFTKNQLDRQVPRHAAWGDRVKRFKELLQECSPASTIAEFPLRLRAIIDSKGGHIEEEFKRARSRK
jgi:hypothetical protein